MGMRYINRVRWMLVLLLVAVPVSIQAEQRYPVSGLVLSVDRSRQTMTVSCHEIPGFMDAMVMSFPVADAKVLESLTRGALIEFTLVVGKEASHAENVRVRRYDSAEREPAKARRLQALDEALRGPVRRLAVGQPVPDFTLTDQQGRSLHFRQFAGKVIAVNFVYTRCALPEYCVRSTNNFGVIQKQFQKRLGKDLVLLTVTFDPVHDRPETLRNYANTWKADPENWRFLTGPVGDVQRVCDLFGVNYVPDEGLFVHSLHSAIVGRDGKLVANLEGNEFTAQQFADLLKTVLDPGQ
jgi:protein SCO1/2